MASNAEEYKRRFRSAFVDEQNTLFGIHVIIYAAVNAMWVLLNMVAVPNKYRWLMFYPIVGWGILVFIHWWFYVKRAESFCMRKEERAEASTKISVGS